MPLRPALFRLSLALTLLLGAAAGCQRAAPGEQAAALDATLAGLQAEFPDDPTATQADGLEQPARRAEKAYAALLALRESHPQDPAVAEACAQAEPRYHELRRRWRLARERRALADLLGGLKVRGYRAARNSLVPRLLDSLASAAHQAAVCEPGTLPPLARETARLAARLVEATPAMGDRTAAANLPTDWRQVAGAIEHWREQEPPEFSLGLGLAFAVLGKTGFALVELERVDPARLDRPEHAALLPLARAIVLSRAGFPELATREATRLSGDTEQGRQLLAAIHALLAYGYAEERNWKQMDRELALAVRAWPNNPLVVFLTGERLLADGRREAALETFEQLAGASEAAWLAPLLARRIREVRDSTGEVPPLALDNGFMVRCVLQSLLAQVERSEPDRPLARLLAAAQQLPALLGAELEP